MASRRWTTEFGAWSDMVQSCNNENSPRYKHFGAKGATVCVRWLTFENFLADMGPRPSKRHGLDRPNPKWAFGPANCRWAPRSGQSEDRRKTKLSFPLAEVIRQRASKGETTSYLASEIGLSYMTVYGVVTGKTWKP